MSPSRPLLERLEDDYAWLRDRKEPNEPNDLTAKWVELVPLSDADEVARARARRLADSKGFGLGALVRQGVRVRHFKSGDTTLAWAVRHADGFVCGIKYRGLGPRFEGRKDSEPGSAFRHPATPTLYCASDDPRLVYVTEGETDAAFLLDRAAPDEAVYCHHAGAMVYHAAWGLALCGFEAVVVATDGDEYGEGLAQRYMADAPHATRLRPTAGKDWCLS